MANARMKYFIRVTNVGIFNSLVQAAEDSAGTHHATFAANRSSRGYYELATASAGLWQELYLYGQVLAQAQDENIEGGEELTL